MDVHLTPPLRVEPISSKAISVDDAHVHLSQFIEKYQDRAQRNGGETTLASKQLEKLAAALGKERSANRTGVKN